MDRTRRARSKSRSKKVAESTSKSPGRGRPRKTPAPSTPPQREPSRRRRGRPLKTDEPPRDRSRSASRSTSRRRAVKKREELSDDETPLIELKKPNGNMSLVLEDIVKSGGMAEIVRASVEREMSSVRRSARITERGSSKKSELVEHVVKTTARVESTPPTKEFGGTLGAMLSAVFLAAVVAALLLACTKEQCTLAKFHVPRNWRYYLGVDALVGVLAFVLCQGVLAALPIGQRIKYNGQELYRANGMLALVLTGGAVGGLWYLQYPVTLTYERHVKAAVSAYIISLVLSIALYIKGGWATLADVNPFGNTGNRIYDFIVGRQLNPMIFSRINVKIVLFRACLSGSLVIDALLALKAFELRKDWSPTLDVLVALKAIYCLDSLWFEDSFSSTFESQYEGVGLLQVQGFLLWPFFSAVLPRFVLTHRIERPPLHLAASVALFIAGYVIYRASNLQKSTFRSNPVASAVVKLDTIPTSRGKKLLVGGWWGVVKKPNYLGDILLQWGIASTIGFTHALPYVVPVVTTLFLVHRAGRDAARCRTRYQAAWDEYHRRVPYHIIPYIY